jgi:hypothetical protein
VGEEDWLPIAGIHKVTNMEYLGQIAYALVLAVPIACLVWTFTQEEIFREFRDTLKTYQREHGDSFWRKKLAYLPTCPYCFSHYVAIMFLGLFRFRMLVSDWRGYVVSLFTLVLIANVYITAYNMLRAALRASKAIADRAEAHANEAKRLSMPMEGWKPKTWPSRIHLHGTANGQWKPLVDRHAVGPNAVRSGVLAPDPFRAANGRT